MNEVTAARFWSNVRKTEGCWVWTGTVVDTGYGHFRVGNRQRLVHRVAYELLIGPIPQGLEPDHECHNQDRTCPGGRACLHRRCVKVIPDKYGLAHIEVVTHAANNARSQSITAANLRKTHCPQGHPYDAENTIWTNGERSCRECNRVRCRERYRRRNSIPPERYRV